MRGLADGTSAIHSPASTRERTTSVNLMQEGWFEDDYFILFADSEMATATARYRLPEFLPRYSIVGIVGWDAFLVRDLEGRTLRIPTVPLDAQYLEPFELAEPLPPLERDDRFTGKIKWYVKPLIFGGEADAESSNLTWVTHEQHAKLVVWWNQQFRQLKGRNAPAGD
jgi:hypothetical protein